jgi:hypothetical protein
MSKFAHRDTSRSNGVYVAFERVEAHDQDADPKDYLFQDGDYRNEDQARLEAWQNEKWHFVGIMARATVEIVRNGVGTLYTLDSPGLWGIESDSGEDYFASIFADECETLRADIEAMGLLTIVEHRATA